MELLLCVITLGLCFCARLCCACTPVMENVTCFCSKETISCTGVMVQPSSEFFEAISDTVRSLGTITAIELNVAQLDSNTEMLFDIPGLQNVTVSAGALNNITLNCITVGTEIRNLNMSQNRFIAIPRESLHCLQSLQFLDFSRNAIEIVQETDLTGVQKLEYLDLSCNCMRLIEDNSFQHLSHLRHLDLKYNNLTLVHTSTFKGLRNLKWLNLASNQLQHINKSTFLLLSSLEHLDLSHNLINIVANLTFESLWTLQTVNLSENEIIFIEPLGFYNLTSLKILDLSGNRLKSFTCLHSISLINLESVFLNRNNMKSIEKGAFCVCANLTHLGLNGNNLECNCKLAPFSEFLKNRHGLLTDNVTCQTPAHFFSKEIVDVDFELLGCPKDAAPMCNVNNISICQSITTQLTVTTRLLQFVFKNGALFLEWPVDNPSSNLSAGCDSGKACNDTGSHNLSTPLLHLLEGESCKICFALYYGEILWAESYFDVNPVSKMITEPVAPENRDANETSIHSRNLKPASQNANAANQTFRMFTVSVQVNESSDEFLEITSVSLRSENSDQQMLQSQWRIPPFSQGNCILHFIFYRKDYSVEGTPSLPCTDSEYIFVPASDQADDVYQTCLLKYQRTFGLYPKCTTLDSSQHTGAVQGATDSTPRNYAFALVFFMIAMLAMVVIAVKFMSGRWRRGKKPESMIFSVQRQRSSSDVSSQNVSKKREMRDEDSGTGAWDDYEEVIEMISYVPCDLDDSDVET